LPVHIHFWSFFTSKKIFTVCSKKSCGIIPITNLNNYEYIKQR
jgi:hypothetical protein